MSCEGPWQSGWLRREVPAAKASADRGRAGRRPDAAGGPSMPIRVLIAENVTMMRAGLVALLDVEPDIDVVAAVESGTEIVQQALEHRPDVALIDIGLPGID